jgi:putative membrane protein
LKAVHENLSSYEGMKIKFTGYVYKILDLESNQFILARDMIISSDYQAVVVGFLSEYSKSSDLKDGAWVEITATITKGSYHNEEIPVLKILSLINTTCPQDEFVYPPDNSYVPTSGMI